MNEDIIIGVFIGALLSFLTSWLLKDRDFALRIWDRLLERKIKAHENLIELAVEMRVMVPTTLVNIEADGEIPRAPEILTSKEFFEKWFRRFTLINQGNSTWLTTEAKREYNFIQDYLINLHSELSSLSSENYIIMGQMIRNDFIELSSSLEKAAYVYFEKEIAKKRLSKLTDWHKYPKEITIQRLNNTVLFSNNENIKKKLKENSEEL